ncbi:condensation domain-containing protein [Nocardia otitidiscaviarum]|uniref:condensation domain-containing protein n=1 Tax=Nocardia otitidiscaviarum TaxID=1823 RepID=UPI002B4B0641|nr:condensation domain-containing protein [Nocardia otitidiscaviarum]
MTTPALRDDDIAIIGIGARFPDAANLDEFRANLAAGRDSIGPMPDSRAEATGLDRRVRYLPMGHLTDIHTFDYAFFGLSKREAALMDPQQRIALELAYRAVEDAGYAPDTLRSASTAVVFSAPMPGYHAMAVDPGPLAMLGNLPFATPARIAHLLGFDGPCYAVDSGCNASLIAVHHACRELRGGDADYALAGGVSVRAGGSPAWTARTMTEIASPGNQVRAFDADADGTVPGEGGAALLLTTLARARADRAPIYAVIRGSAVLHNGHSSATISTPSAATQARVIDRAWHKAGVDPRTAGYLEAHGSATRLGDAVELEGLRTAFADRDTPLPIGSVKTNIGHLDHAAGVAGLVKAVLSVAHGQLFPSLHFHRPTGDLDLAAAGIEVVTTPRPWPGGTPRLAGVSSYSLGGANAHCVIQQAPDARQPAPATVAQTALTGDRGQRVERVAPPPHAAELRPDIAARTTAGSAVAMPSPTTAPPATDPGPRADGTVPHVRAAGGMAANDDVPQSNSGGTAEQDALPPAASGNRAPADSPQRSDVGQPGMVGRTRTEDVGQAVSGADGHPPVDDVVPRDREAGVLTTNGEVPRATSGGSGARGAPRPEEFVDRANADLRHSAGRGRSEEGGRSLRAGPAENGRVLADDVGRGRNADLEGGRLPHDVGRVDGAPVRRLVGVSARTPAALVELCGTLARYVRGGAVEFADVAYTLGRGRSHFGYRVAVTASGNAELADALDMRGSAVDQAGARPAAPRVALLLSPGATPVDPRAGAGAGAEGTHSTAAGSVDAGGTIGEGPTHSAGVSLPVQLTAVGAVADVLAGQLAAHDLLRDWGIRFGAVLSGGASKFLARYLLGSRERVDAGELAAAAATPTVDRARLRTAAETLLRGGSVVFVDPSRDGVLGRFLAEDLADRSDAEVLFGAPDSGGPLGILARLYERGVDLDWGMQAVEGRRVRLPGHPMHGTRCWVDLPTAAAPTSTGAATTPAASDAATTRATETASVSDPAATATGAGSGGTVTDTGVPATAIAAAGVGGTATAADVAATVGAVTAAPADASASDEAAARTRRTPVPEDATAWLSGVLRELLHAEAEIGPDDDYFDVGGNSIIAVQLVERVEETFGFRPKLLDVYERPTVADFADLLRTGARTAEPAASPAVRGVPPITRTDELVMSPGQERMWFHHQLVPDTTLYNYPVVNLLRGPIDIDAVKGTFEDFAERHEPLRYNLVEENGLPAVRVRPALVDFFRVVDVSGDPDPVARARALIQEAAVRPFDLARDPMVRVLVVTLSADTHVLQVVCHHCVTDGQTPGILAREIPVLYAARQEGRTAELEPLPIRYRDYARWHRELLDSGALDHELDYWVHVLRDAPKLRLPTDFPRPARKTFTGELEPFTVPAALLAAARTVAKRESVSLFVVLLAAFYLLLARRSGQRDLVVGTPTTGRTRRELEGLIGFFNSTVALRANLSGPATLADVLERVRAIVLGALENQEIPFERVVHALDDQRDLSRTPIFDVLYVHQDLTSTGAANPLSGEETEFFDLEHSIHNAFGGLPPGTAKFDLSLITYDRSDDHDMLACFEYSTELFTQRTAAGFAAAYLDILTEVVDSAPERSIEELIAPAPAPLAEAEETAALDIPTDRPRGTHTGYTPGVVRERLESAPADADLLAAWVALLSWYSGSDEVAVALPNGVARMDLADEPTGSDLCARAAATLEAPAGPAGTAALRFGDTPTETTELALARATDDLSVLDLSYATELFDESTARQLLADLVRLLRGLRETPEDPVPDIAVRRIAEAEVIR